MKCLLIAATLIITTSAFAGTKPNPKHGRKVAQEEIQCADSINGIVEQVKGAPGCYDAMAVAKACATYGSSADGQIITAAQVVCEKDFKKITKDDALLKAKMARRCEKICNAIKDGTMCMSFISGCKLTVTNFWAQFYSANSANN